MSSCSRMSPRRSSMRSTASPSTPCTRSGEGGRDTVVTGFRAINSATHPDEVIDEIAGANVVTTAVGPTILKFVAPHIVAGLALRDPSSPPLQIMACENAINATDLLRDEIVALAGDAWDALAGRAVFANTAVDRIVPAQPEGSGVDVTVEPFYEWAIERPPFGDDPPQHSRRALRRRPRALHRAEAVHGEHRPRRDGVLRRDRRRRDDLRRALGRPTSRRGSAQRSRRPPRSWSPSTDSTPPTSQSYRETILRRFRNPALPDTVWRVGRQPLRKLSRHERFVGPAAEAAERGLSVDALVGAMGAALAFDDAEDAQSVDLQRMLREQDAASVTSSVTGLEPGHPLFSRFEADRGGAAGGARVIWRGDRRRSPGRIRAAGRR